jgi:hypothetical protein
LDVQAAAAKHHKEISPRCEEPAIWLKPSESEFSMGVPGRKYDAS